MKHLAFSLSLFLLVLSTAACGDGTFGEVGQLPVPTASSAAVDPAKAATETPEPTQQAELTLPTASLTPSPSPQPPTEAAPPTNTPEPEKPPPSGRIAFVSNQNGADAIFVMDVADPAGAQQLTQPDASGFDWWPTWCSEDEILFEGNDGAEWKEVVSLNLNDGSIETLTSSNLPNGSVMNGAPVCSRGGRFLALSSRHQNPYSDDWGWHIGIIDRTDDSFSIIGDYQYNARHFSWSPDGNEAVFMHLPLSYESTEFQLFLVPLDNSESFLNLSENSGLNSKYPSWSPISDQIAFACSEGEDDDRIWSLCLSDADQEGISILLPEVGFGPEQESRTGGRMGYFITPSWSPDGSHLTFASNMDGNWDIFVVETATGELINLTNTPDIDEMQPTWGP